MKIKLDENIPRSLADILGAFGHMRQTCRWSVATVRYIEDADLVRENPGKTAR